MFYSVQRLLFLPKTVFPNVKLQRENDGSDGDGDGSDGNDSDSDGEDSEGSDRSRCTWLREVGTALNIIT